MYRRADALGFASDPRGGSVLRVWLAEQEARKGREGRWAREKMTRGRSNDDYGISKSLSIPFTVIFVVYVRVCVSALSPSPFRS